MRLAVPIGQLPASPSKLLTNATLPLVALRLIRPPLMLASGNGAPSAPPEASDTSRYWPAPIVPPSGCRFTAQPLPVADAYCKDQPLRFTGPVPRLNNST